MQTGLKICDLKLNKKQFVLMISFYMHNSQIAKHAFKGRGKNINLD